MSSETQSQPRFSIADHDAPVASEEFAQAIFEEPWRYELVNGKLVVMSPTGDEHVEITEPFRDALVAYKLALPQRVARVVSDAWIRINQTTQRIADLAVYLSNPRTKLKIPLRIPELIFEVVSGGGEDRKRDYVDKRAEYLRIGVKEYVIVDRFERRVTVLRRSRGRFVESHLGPGDVYTSPLLPGLKIPLKGII
ncbi:MAG TPA: Uma2 family endonuclease [Planctomycetaceae bacterium]|nr:Uma2 family endonuclease [Planctomycetaceae bacterium]